MASCAISAVAELLVYI